MSRLGRVAFVVHAAALIATPLRRRGRRTGLANVVIAGLAATTFDALVRRDGLVRATLSMGATAAATGAIEHVGVSTGWPFGRYSYTDTLRPRVAGVPALVPMAWFAMALPSREVGRALAGAGARRRRRWLAGSAALTAWDLFLDPQMVAEGHWHWNRRGRYRAIPLSNYLGWFATGVVVMALLDATSGDTSANLDATLVGEYAWMAVMETIGFAAFFDDRLVAAVGGLGMLPAAASAALALYRQAGRRG